MPGPLSDPGFVVEEHRFEELDWPDSRAPSPGAAEERPVAQHRRGRDELEANDRENLVQGPSKKQRLGVANEVSNSLGLEDHEREEVKRLSQVS
ncbi:hypothetical protein FRC12_001906 [Ceratobasidium sp. 428]|nr:hypothetical protein FRC12_001906 [Ceratobasidium sp. 428]